MGNFGRVQSIERAVKVLNCFSDRNAELKLTEIAQYLDINKSTLHGIITTMKDAGLIDQNSENQKYRLGLKLAELGGLVLRNLDIRAVARPILMDLCDEEDETIHLGILEGKEIIYIDKVESNQSLRMFTTIGTRYHAYCTAIGKSILAFKSPEALENHLPENPVKHTAHTKNTREAILEELEKVREKGFALDLEENVIGLNCVGAPIFNHESKVEYSISISGPVDRMDMARLEMLSGKMKAAALEISRRIGYLE
ncbi:MAG: hypothetical protein AVO33_09660 [delta proteobacterium ML8_F1]|nr:MAG: hypothetical protein AVO33_09660 [delta proteobacterium ML8_F1]